MIEWSVWTAQDNVGLGRLLQVSHFNRQLMLFRYNHDCPLDHTFIIVTMTTKVA